MPLDRWIAIDFETATAEPGSACALGIAVVEDLRIVETASWLIQPPANQYHWACTRVHGISEDDTAQSPEFGEIWPEISEYLDGSPLLAHNAPFDARVLSAAAARSGITLPQMSIGCTVALSRRVLPALPNHKLPTVCSACGIGLTHHDAFSDALACANVAIMCAHVSNAATISEALETRGVRLRPVPGNA